jgi:nitrous oxide reductase accessory protein NosL
MRGPDLPAFVDAAAAAAFVAREGGKPHAFEHIDTGLLRTLRDANHARHMH